MSTLSGLGRIRVIGGQWRGRKLTVKLSPRLRPTPNRLRETLFNWLQPCTQDADCLDLFAGTGSLGFEAVSRGAATATLIENNTGVFEQLKIQCRKFNTRNVSLIRMDALAWLRQNKIQFDLVFLDPPFNQDLVAKSCASLIENRALKPGSLVYVESEPELEMPERWTIRKQSRAGHVQCGLIEYSG